MQAEMITLNSSVAIVSGGSVAFHLTYRVGSDLSFESLERNRVFEGCWVFIKETSSCQWPYGLLPWTTYRQLSEASDKFPTLEEDDLQSASKSATQAEMVAPQSTDMEEHVALAKRRSFTTLCFAPFHSG